MNSLKFVDVELTSDGNGMWIYEDASFMWNVDDSLEYWLSVEASNLGYYSNQVVKVQGKERFIASPSERTFKRINFSINENLRYHSIERRESDGNKQDSNFHNNPSSSGMRGICHNR